MILFDILILLISIVGVSAYTLISWWIYRNKPKVWDARMRPHVANSATLIRTFLFFIYIWRMLENAHVNEFLHFAFFIAAGIAQASDYIDGKLSRTVGISSEIGRDLDPLADKLTTFGMLSVLLYLGYFQALIFFFMLFRDFVVTVMRLLSKKFAVDFSTSPMGKMRANIVGFGGACIYGIYYWGETGIWYTLIGIAVVATLDSIFTPNRGVMRKYNLGERFVIVISLIITAIYPRISIAYSMLWITFWTLIDYSFCFYKGARGRVIAKEIPVIRWYLHVFENRRQRKQNKEIQKLENKIARKKEKRFKLDKKINQLEIKLENRQDQLEGGADLPLKHKRWPKILKWLILSTGSILLITALMTSWVQQKWFGQIGLIGAIVVIGGIFILLLIIKLFFTKRPKQQQTTKQQNMLSEADSNSGM